MMVDNDCAISKAVPHCWVGECEIAIGVACLSELPVASRRVTVETVFNSSAATCLSIDGMRCQTTSTAFHVEGTRLTHRNLDVLCGTAA